MRRVLFGRVWTVSAVLAMAGAASGQDSVAQTPGDSDALSAFGEQRVRYVVDLAPITSSWGTTFGVAPLLKAHADIDPMFPTQLVGALAVSADQIGNVTFPAADYSVWSSPGAGVNPSANSAPNVVGVTGFDARFGVAMSDLSTGQTNIAGALVGRDAAEPDRLYVERVMALTSRSSATGDDTGTVSIGAVDADGVVHARADEFNGAGSLALVGDSIVQIATAARATTANFLLNSGGLTLASDALATTVVVGGSGVVTNVPSAIPGSIAGSATSLLLDFAGGYSVDGGGSTTAHVDPQADAHRGNPAFVGDAVGLGVGTVGSLARRGGLTDTINVFEVDASGGVVATEAATLPSPVTDGLGFSTNTAGDAEFLQYLSQTSFRGGNGQVAVHVDGVDVLAAATATDPTDGAFIALARIGAAASWTVVAHEGKAVLDGVSGTPVGVIASASPVSMSSPAMDAYGNVYFVAAFDATVGPDATALIKGVNVGGVYQLELLLKTGDSVGGVNSGRTYTIDALTLGDSDSVASGSVFSSSVVRGLRPGVNASAVDPEDADAFGGVVVGAQITYNNGGVPESYDTALFVGPVGAQTPTGCEGDADGNGAVDVNDITFVVNRLGQSPGVCGPGDVDGNGAVDVNDLTFVVNRLGTCDPATTCP